MDKIEWYFKNDKVGEAPLHEHSTGEERDDLAFNVGFIARYDNFKIVRPNGYIRYDASETKLPGGELFGEFSGRKYDAKVIKILQGH